MNLSHNLISVAKFPLKNVKYHVETLDLSYNNISDFFFEYSAELKNLILSNNRLKRINDRFEKMKLKNTSNLLNGSIEMVRDFFLRTLDVLHA